MQYVDRELRLDVMRSLIRQCLLDIILYTVLVLNESDPISRCGVVYSMKQVKINLGSCTTLPILL